MSQISFIIPLKINLPAGQNAQDIRIDVSLGQPVLTDVQEQQEQQEQQRQERLQRMRRERRLREERNRLFQEQLRREELEAQRLKEQQKEADKCDWKKEGF